MFALMTVWTVKLLIRTTQTVVLTWHTGRCVKIFIMRYSCADFFMMTNVFTHTLFIYYKVWFIAIMTLCQVITH